MFNFFTRYQAKIVIFAMEKIVESDPIMALKIRDKMAFILRISVFNVLNEWPSADESIGSFLSSKASKDISSTIALTLAHIVMSITNYARNRGDKSMMYSSSIVSTWLHALANNDHKSIVMHINAIETLFISNSYYFEEKQNQNISYELYESLPPEIGNSLMRIE